MIDGWIIDVVLVFAGIISGYAVQRYKVLQLEAALKSHIETDEKIHGKENAAFLEAVKAIEKGLDRLTALEHDTANLLTLAKAEEKFVSKLELELHLKNIELQNRHILSTVDNTNKMVEAIALKMEKMVRRGD